MQNQQRIRSGFNFLAPIYDFASYLFFGNSILHSQTFFFSEFKKCKNILVFGGGTGKLLIELIKRDISEHYCYVDISDKMIEKTRARLKKSFPEKLINVHFICGTSNDIGSNNNFDLIITPHILDCLSAEELPIVLRQLKSNLIPGEKWLFTDFNIPENRKSKLFSSIKIRMMYFGFNIICGLGIKKLPDFEKEFERLNYIVENEKYFLNSLLVSRIYKENTN